MGTNNVLSDEGLSENIVDKAYNALLKTGDGEKMTDDEAAAISSVLEDHLPDDAKLLRDIQEGEYSEEIDKDVKEETIEAKVTIDPFSGKATKIDVDDNNSCMSLDDILDNGGVLNKTAPEDIDYSETAIASALKSIYNTELSEAELAKLTTLLIKATKGETVKYNELPAVIKSKIATAIVMEKGSKYAGNYELRNQMTKIFIEALIQEVTKEEVNEIFVDLQDSIRSITREGFGEAYKNAYNSQRDIMIKELPNIADKIEEKEPEKAALMRAMNKAFIQSYTLEDMLNTYINTGKCKIKKYDLEKVERVYDGFNRKYEKSKWIVRDISMLEPVLTRRLSDEYTITHIRAFLVVFCKYTMNMNPDASLSDHTFMYYFIMNILSLDAFDPENESDAKFYNELVATIENFIDKIKEKAKL